MTRMGKVSFGGVVKDINLACVPDARTGDYVIVHVGVAISTVDPQEAERVFADLQEIERLGRQGSAADAPARGN